MLGIKIVGVLKSENQAEQLFFLQIGKKNSKILTKGGITLRGDENFLL